MSVTGKALIALCLSGLAIIATTSAHAQSKPILTGDGGVPDFYTWDKPSPAKPGKLLRQEPLVEKSPMSCSLSATQ